MAVELVGQNPHIVLGTVLLIFIGTGPLLTSGEGTENHIMGVYSAW